MSTPTNTTTERRVDITSVASDEETVYMGTSSGKIVAIPIQTLIPPPEQSSTSANDEKQQFSPLMEDLEEPASNYLSQSAVSVHAHNRKVRSLFSIPVPESQDKAVFSSTPDLMSTASVPCTQRPAFKSLLVSTGKGHVEYTEEDYNLDPEEVTAFRERKESFQLQVWGHHNTDHHRLKLSY